MDKQRTKVSVAVAAISLLLAAGCNSDAQVETTVPAVAAAPASNPAPRPIVVAAAKPACQNCGTVTNIKKLTKDGGDDHIGMIAGAVIGGVLGNQVGHGDSKTAATVAGAVGGGYVGNEIEKNNSRDDDGYRITIHMDGGGDSRIKVGSRQGLQEGDRVRVTGGKNIQRV